MTSTKRMEIRAGKMRTSSLGRASINAKDVSDDEAERERGTECTAEDESGESSVGNIQIGPIRPFDCEPAV